LELSLKFEENAYTDDYFKQPVQFANNILQTLQFQHEYNMLYKSPSASKQIKKTSIVFSKEVPEEYKSKHIMAWTLRNKEPTVIYINQLFKERSAELVNYLFRSKTYL